MKTKILRKKLVVFLLSCMMVVGFIPVTSLAADPETVTITIPSTMHVQSGKLTVAKGQKMEDVILTIDEDYHENGEITGKSIGIGERMELVLIWIHIIHQNLKFLVIQNVILT